MNHLDEKPDRLSDLEFAKINIDVVKHITTLSTGSILLIATFLDRFPNAHAWSKWLLILALVCLTVCLGISSLFLANYAKYGSSSPDERLPKLTRSWLARHAHFSAVLLMVGIFSIAGFAIINIIRP